MALGDITRVTQGGLPYTIAGAQRKTVTDVIPGDASEAVTAAQLGLNVVEDAKASIQDGQTSDTGVYQTAAISDGGNTVTIATFNAAGAAATIAADSVSRVTAFGK